MEIDNSAHLQLSKSAMIIHCSTQFDGRATLKWRETARILARTRLGPRAEGSVWNYKSPATKRKKERKKKQDPQLPFTIVMFSYRSGSQQLLDDLNATPPTNRFDSMSMFQQYGGLGAQPLSQPRSRKRPEWGAGLGMGPIPCGDLP